MKSRGNVEAIQQALAPTQSCYEIECEILSVYCPKFQITAPPAALDERTWIRHINTLLSTDTASLWTARVRDKTGQIVDAVVFEVPARDRDRIVRMVETQHNFDVPLCQGRQSSWLYQSDLQQAHSLLPKLMHILNE